MSLGVAASLLPGVAGATSLLLGVEGAANLLLVTAACRPPGETAVLPAVVTAVLGPGTAESFDPVDSLLPGVLKCRLCLAPFPGVAELGRVKPLPCLARAGLGACIGPASDPFRAEPSTGFTALPTFLTLDILVGTVILLAGVMPPPSRTKDPFTAGIDNPVLILLLTFWKDFAWLIWVLEAMLGLLVELSS